MWRLYVFYGVVARCCVVYNFTPRRAEIARKPPSERTKTALGGVADNGGAGGLYMLRYTEK